MEIELRHARTRDEELSPVVVVVVVVVEGAHRRIHSVVQVVCWMICSDLLGKGEEYLELVQAVEAVVRNKRGGEEEESQGGVTRRIGRGEVGYFKSGSILDKGQPG